MATDVTSLLNDGRCVCADIYGAVEYALLTQILLAFDPMAATDLPTLIANGADFSAITQNPYQIARLQLLREIAMASGGGVPVTFDQIKFYTADPNAEGVVPGDQTAGAIAIPTSGAGPWFSWNAITLTWV